MSSEDVLDFLSDLGEIPPDPPKKRDTCDKCCRPATVCWCPFLPEVPVHVRSRVIILQHPYEENRRLKTAPILYHSLQDGHCTIFKGRRFNLKKNQYLQDIVESPDTLLLYPSPASEKLSDLTARDPHKSDLTARDPHKSDLTARDPHKSYNLILLDGTWLQARGIFCQNAFLQRLKQVKLGDPGESQYVIRTQPTSDSLSTLETAVLALAQLEHSPHIVEPLLRPLRAMCDFQMSRGAVKHHSKQFLVEQGLYKKQPPPGERISYRRINKAARKAAESLARDQIEDSNVDPQSLVKEPSEPPSQSNNWMLNRTGVLYTSTDSRTGVL